MTETPAMNEIMKKVSAQLFLKWLVYSALQASIWNRFYSSLQVNENMQLK